MEKYAIDIDRVLDEFEETEALKISAVPQLADCFKKQASSLEQDIWPETSLVVEPPDSSILDKNILYRNIDKLNECTNHNDSDNVKNFSFNIFYKSPESPDLVNNQPETLNCISDEILCISVLQNSSHTNNAKALLPSNAQSNNFVSIQDIDASNHFDIPSSNAKNNIFDAKQLEFNSETQKEVTCPDSMAINFGQESNEQLILQPSCCQSTLVNNNIPETPDLIVCDMKERDYSIFPGNKNQTGNDNGGLFCIDFNSQDIVNAIRGEEKGLDILSSTDRNGLIDNIQDDDSGVSSTEDISGNSPPEVMNNKAGSVGNEKCDMDDKCPVVENVNNDCNDISVSSENFLSNESNFTSKLSSQKHENKESVREDKADSFVRAIEKETMYKQNDFTKYEKKPTEISEIVTCSQDDLKIIKTNQELIDSSLPMSPKNKNYELDKSKLVDSDSSPVSKNVVCTYPEVLEAKATECSSSDVSSYMEEGKDYVDKFVCKQINLGENETEDISTIFLEANRDSISRRLQRPTTLNLSSMLVSSDEASADSQHESCDRHEQLITISTEVSDEKDSGITPCENHLSNIGMVKPYWIPDAEAINCMHCEMKFTVLKRRHHCRGCGKVLCSRCCNQKAYLAYLNKEDRICQPCADILASILQNDHISISLDSQSSSSCGSSPNFSPSNFTNKNIWKPHPNNPDDYCSVIPPLQQIQIAGTLPPPTVMVPTGVLKRGNKHRREPKQVIFSDGIRPGGDLSDLAEAIETVPVYRRIAQSHTGVDLSLSSETAILKSTQKRVILSDEEGTLPPIVLQIDNESDETLDWNQFFEKLQDGNQPPIHFALMKNLHLFVKIVTLDCCFGNECWYFTSHGLCTVGQDEVMVIMEKIPGENTVPRDILKLFRNIYDSASKGSTFDELSHIFFSEKILGSNDHRGFLFVRPTFQCLSKLIVPKIPYLVAILIHKWEVPWAKVFPLRLMLRMGAECRYYPCSLVSIRYRKPVYFEIGQTIMSVLADLRNFQFTIPLIPGLVVHMEEKKTFVNIPRNRYEKLIKVLNNNNVEHVLALGANFSTEADSHLVCMQNEEGDYQTQAINIENTTRKVTGASFIVFSGALKTTSGLSAKFSIVEDGLLVQISQDTMVALHMALRDMRDMSIDCGQINTAPEETVIVQWTRDDKKFNIGVQSPIDSRSLEGISNLRIHTSTDYAGENYLIRWTEVFFFDVDDGSSAQNELMDPCRLAETVAQSCCMVLSPYLDQLADAELIKLGLRVTLDSQQDKVEYEIGARGKALPGFYMNSLDSGLIPVILRLSNSTPNEKLSFELIFHVMIK